MDGAFLATDGNIMMGYLILFTVLIVELALFGIEMWILSHSIITSLVLTIGTVSCIYIVLCILDIILEG